MNKQRRNQLIKLAEELRDTASRFEDIKTEIENILEEEQSALDNLPDSLQASEKGASIQTAIDAIAEADNHVEETISSIESAAENLMLAAE